MVSESIGINTKGTVFAWGGRWKWTEEELARSEVLGTQPWTDRLLRKIPRLYPIGVTAWLQHSPKSLPSPLLSVIHPSAPVSLFFCLGQCYTLLRSRFCLQHLSHPLAPLLLSLMILSLPILSHHSSVLSVHPKESHPAPISISPSASLIFCLPIRSPSSPPTHTLIQYSYFRGHLWAWNRACASAPFSVQRKPTFSPRAFPCPPPLPYLANPDSGFGFVLLIFF